jgi:hypothetical protein
VYTLYSLGRSLRVVKLLLLNYLTP